MPDASPLPLSRLLLLLLLSALRLMVSHRRLRRRHGAACRDGPSLAVALFNRICREEARPRVAMPTVCTYTILMDCCCRTRRPNVGFALFGRLLKTGVIVASILLKCLCHAKWSDDAVNVLLHRMPELGVEPDNISYNTVLKTLCEDSRSQRALDLLHTMVKKSGGCSSDVVSYSTVIHGFFREGEVSKACNCFHEMMQQGVVPSVVTYNSIIDALCKARAMDQAELVLHQMIIIDAYGKCGMMDEAMLVFTQMQERGVIPDACTYGIVITALSRMGRLADAMDKFDQMIAMGLKPNGIVYHSLIQRFCERPNVITFNSLIDGYGLVGKMEKAFGVLEAMASAGVEPDVVTKGKYREHIKSLPAMYQFFDEFG
ncbi:hypothetical protein BRADI_2g38453v3 [Brachypodium distachyon]|uniref:Pentacotripeptide-repeat region of PRORP domain-containing protein n=1 Tax=Brachypodium distachyon TaxID=15368 RepID=A0A2K2DCK0_BRADI|nr:hypothetical protein BRADI_2g38453v3 [Brachypodium distachyon]